MNQTEAFGRVIATSLPFAKTWVAITGRNLDFAQQWWNRAAELNPFLEPVAEAVINETLPLRLALVGMEKSLKKFAPSALPV